MGLFAFNDTEILAFFLVLVRMSAFVVSWPVFGVVLVPRQVKVLFAFIVAIVLFPTVGWQQVTGELATLNIIWMAVREAFIGLSLGFLARMFFFSVGMAAEMMSLSMGISAAQLYNPAIGSQSSALQQTYVALATLFFLGVQGHHLFLSALVHSYELVPIGINSLSFAGLESMGAILQKIMELALMMCMPIMLSILFMNVAMAVIGRTVPQINVLITSLPVNILVGFLVLTVTLPLLIGQMTGILNITADQLFGLLKSF